MNKGKDTKEKIQLPFAMSEKEGHNVLRGAIRGRLSAQKSASLARAKSLSLQITTINQLVWYYTMPPAMACVGLEK